MKEPTTAKPGLGAPTAVGIDVAAVAPEAVPEIIEPPPDESFVQVTSDFAHNLVQTLFAGTQRQIPGVRYATAYKVAEGYSGGDVVDVFHFNNDHVMFVVADVSGKGNNAAVPAALIKYGLRTLASNGLMCESVMRSLNRLYLEQSAFEGDLNSFAASSYP